MAATVENTLKQAVDAHIKKRLPEAELLYRKILTQDSENLDALHNLGILLSSVGNIRESNAFLKKAYNLSPTNKTFFKSYVVNVIKLGMFDQAERLIHEFKNNVGETPDFRLLKESCLSERSKFLALQSISLADRRTVSHLYGNKNFSECLRSAKTLLQKSPRAPFLYSMIGLCELAFGNKAGALSWYIKGLEVHPRDPELLNNAGNIHKDNGDIEKAIVLYRMSISFNPKLPHSHCNLATIYRMLGHLSAAESELNLALKLKPDFFEAHLGLGNVYSDVGNYDKALKSYLFAAKLNPNSIQAKNNLATCYLNKGDFENAKKGYESILSVHPADVSSYLNLAQAFESWNKVAELQKLLEKAEQVFSKYPSTLYFYNAKLCFRNEQFIEASNFLSKVNISELNSARRIAFWELSGKVHEKLAVYDKAFQDYTKKSEETKKSVGFRLANPKQFRDSIAEELKTMNQQNSLLRFEMNQDLGFQAVFLIAFPRSGTTLLNTMLGTHSRVNIMEELPFLENSRKTLLGSIYQNVFSDAIDKMRLDKSRLQYGKNVIEKFERRKLDIVVDKMPLNIVQVPFIETLLPNSKYIFVKRNPYDVVLSNWSQSFKMNDAMANMVDLKTAANLYSLVMHHFIAFQKLK